MIKTKDMNRPEIIWELAKYAHPTWYHSLLDWETHQLRELLAHYRGEIKTLPTGLGRIYRTKGLGDTPAPGDIVLTIVIKSGDGQRHKIAWGSAFEATDVTLPTAILPSAPVTLTRKLTVHHHG